MVVKSKMGIFDLIIGCILIAFGIFKMTVGLLAIILSNKTKKKFKLIRDDPTIAGLVFDLVLTVFGLYSVLHGLALIEALPKWLSIALASNPVVYTIYALFGIVMTCFFSLIVFTKLPISKTPIDILTYEVAGIGGGFCFFISLFGLMIYNTLIENGWTMDETVLTLVLLIVACLAVIGVLIWDAIRRKKAQNNLATISLRTEFLTLAMIPLGASG